MTPDEHERLVKLESAQENHSETLTRLEGKLDGVKEDISEIKQTVARQNGAINMAIAIWGFVSGLVVLVATWLWNKITMTGEP